MILNACVLHFNNRLDLGVLAFPSRFIQSSIFNVGAFFFFTSGYMGYQVYLPRLKQGWR